MRTALVIGWKDLRQRIRDRSAFVIAFIAPLALASIISVTFGTITGPDFHATLVVVDADGSELSGVFVDEVLGSDELRDSITVVRAEDAQQARSMIDGDEAAAGFLIPAGFEEAVSGGQDVTMTVLRSSGGLSAQFAEGIANAFIEQVNATRLSVATAFTAGGGDIPALAAAAADVQMPVALVDGGVGGDAITGANYFGPSMGIFFLFLTVGWGARSLFVERRQGTLQRLLAAPVSRGSVLAGKGIAVFVLGLASMTTMFVFLGVVFGAEWGDPVAVAALTVAIVLAAMAITSAVATLAKTDEQADAYSSMVAITLALLGGNFLPIHLMPETIQRISLATPNGWALRGFTDLAYDGGGLGSVSLHILVIGAFTTVMGVAALLGARRVTAR